MNSDYSLVLPRAVTSNSPSWKFQVLFSFREEETCNKFTDHLYTTFKGSGLTVFTDDKKLQRGEVFCHGGSVSWLHFFAVVLVWATLHPLISNPIHSLCLPCLLRCGSHLCEAPARVFCTGSGGRPWKRLQTCLLELQGFSKF